MVSISGNANSLRPKPEQAFPLHFGRKDHIAPWTISARRAPRDAVRPALFATSSRASQSCSVVVEKRLLLLRGPLKPPNDAAK